MRSFLLARQPSLTHARRISYRSSPPASPPRGIASRPTRKSLPAPRQTPKKQNKSFPPPERTNDLFYDGPLGPAPSSDCAEAGRTLVLMRSKSFENENRCVPPSVLHRPG